MNNIVYVRIYIHACKYQAAIRENKKKQINNKTSKKH